MKMLPYITSIVLSGIVLFAPLKAACPLQADPDILITAIEEDILIQKDYGGTITKLKILLAEYPEDKDILMYLGLAYYGLGEYGIAYEYLKESEIVSLLDYDKTLFAAIKIIEENRNLYDEITETQKSMEEASPEIRTILHEVITARHIKLLNIIIKEKTYSPAMIVPHVYWLIENRSDVKGMHRILGEVFSSKGYYDKAIRALETAQKEEPRSEKVAESLAEALVARGEYEEAEKKYMTAIDILKSKGLFKNIGDIYRLRKIKNSLPKRYMEIAELIRLGQLNDAERLTREKLSKYPFDHVAITHLGEIYWEKGARASAIRLIRKAVVIAPSYPPARFMLGKAYFFENKMDKAVGEFKMFKSKMEDLPKLDPGIVDYYIRAMHEIAYFASIKKDYESILKECDSILAIMPDDQAAHYNKAVCYYLYKHNSSAAYRELKKVIDINPESKLADLARFYIDYIRNNPDSRMTEDFTFITKS